METPAGGGDPVRGPGAKSRLTVSGTDASAGCSGMPTTALQRPGQRAAEASTTGRDKRHPATALG